MIGLIEDGMLIMKKMIMRFINDFKNNGARSAFGKAYIKVGNIIFEKYKKLAIFASFRSDGQIYDEAEYFLTELKGIIYGRNPLVDTGEKPVVLLVSHEMRLSGAPVALFYFARELKNRGMEPVIVSPQDGLLREHICREGIPVIIYKNVYNQELIANWVHFFSLVIVNTILGGPLIRQLNGLSIPVLWWIHEADQAYYARALNSMPLNVAENIHVYCVGPYAEKVLLKYRPDYKCKSLLYYLPDYMKTEENNKDVIPVATKGKTVFVTVGLIEPRKGQDILVEAIRLLPQDKLKRCFFAFVGHECYQPYLTAIQDLQKEKPDNMCYLGEIDMDLMPDLYRQSDCLICSSRDDPMPIVVTEALSLSKLVICSENTGSAELLKRNNSGLVYPDNDPEQLAHCILQVLEHSNQMESFKTAARQTYEEFFSKEAFDSAVFEVLNEVSP